MAKAPIEKKKLEPSLAITTPIHHVRFHQPVPPGLNKEPVGEFVLSGKQSKYLVDSLSLTPHGVMYQAYGETGLVPLANVIYCRFTI